MNKVNTNISIAEKPDGAYVCPLCYNFGLLFVEFTNSYYKHCDYKYCRECDLFFDLTHIHEENGCTDSTYWFKTITKFKLDNEEHVGAPSIGDCKLTVREQLDDEHDLSCSNVEIIEEKCTCNGKVHGPKGLYPATKFPEYYEFDCPVVFTRDTNIGNPKYGCVCCQMT